MIANLDELVVLKHSHPPADSSRLMRFCKQVTPADDKDVATNMSSGHTAINVEQIRGRLY